MKKTFESAKSDFQNWHSEQDRGYKTKCWIWKSPDYHRGGYGRVWFSNSAVSAHRFSWLIYRGEIPVKIEVCHHCDVKECVNPDHLFLGTHLDNIRDAYSKNLIPALRGTMQPQAKMDDEKVRYCRANYKRGIVTYKMLGKMFGVDGALIARIVKGKKWGHVK